MTAAALLPPVRRPPHDPLWLPLGGRYGWRIAPASINVAVDPCGGALVLAANPDAGRFLAEPAGSFGGLSLPSHVAVDADAQIWLLDRKSATLKRFDLCSCAFIALPCTAGLGGGARQLVTPGSIAALGPLLLVTDTGPPGRLLVFDRRSLALRGIWQPPPGATAQPWRPSAVATDGRRILVADIANGAIHVFSPLGGWKGVMTGFGAVIAMALDCDGRIYTVLEGEDAVRIADAQGAFLGTAARPTEILCRFTLPPFCVAADGRIDVTGCCPGAGWFDASGLPAEEPEDSAAPYAGTGAWVSQALDSGIARCVWHRVVLNAALPERCTMALSVFTADAELPDDHIQALPPQAWLKLPAIADGAGDVLIQAPPGRYLWLRGALSGPGTATPRLCAMNVEFPRISLRRYLPAVFGADPISAEFTDRLLAIFDRGFRDVETVIDNEASLFDPRSAPTGKGMPDMLGALYKWVGLSFDASWSVQRRRDFLAKAPRLFACLGTPQGLRHLLLTYLGFDTRSGGDCRSTCAPRCASLPPAWAPPPLILEHWKLRRWLFVGASRIGDAAVLWGEKLLGRSRLGDTAQTGVTRLDSVRDPLRDPFHKDAHRFSVFVPANIGRSPRARASLKRVIDRSRPAHTAARLVFVEPRMRIGIQASIGLDAVIGCWPAGIALDETKLGAGSVLTGKTSAGPAMTIGRATIQEGRS